MIGGKIEHVFVVNPDKESLIEGILIDKSDSPSPLVSIALVGRLTKNPGHKDHISLRDNELFPGVAGLIQKFDDMHTNDYPLSLEDRTKIVGALTDKLGAEVASKATLAATYAYYADVALLHAKAPTRTEFLDQLPKGASIASSTQVLRAQQKVVRTLTDSPLLGRDKNIRQAIASTVQAVLAQGRSVNTGQFL